MASGLFGNVGVPDPDEANPPPRHRVGFVGRDPIGMSPRNFAAWLGGQMEKREQATERRSMDRILSHLSPAERVQAQIFGLDYVEKQRAFEQQKELLHEQNKSLIDMRAEDARLAAEDKEALKREDADTKKRDAVNLYQSLFAGLGARPQTDAPESLGHMAGQRPVSAAMNVVTGLIPGAAAMRPSIAAVDRPKVRVIENELASQIFAAQKAAGVAPMLPQGFVLQTDLEQARAAETAQRNKEIAIRNREAEKKQKAEQKIAENLAEAKAMLREAGQEMTPEIEADIKNGVDIGKVLSIRAKLDAKVGKKIVERRKEYEQAQKSAKTARTKADAIRVKLAKKKDVKGPLGQVTGEEYEVTGEAREVLLEQLSRYDSETVEMEEKEKQHRVEYLLERYDAKVISDTEREELKELLADGEEVSMGPKDEYPEEMGAGSAR